MRYEEVSPPDIYERGCVGLHVAWIAEGMDMITGHWASTIVKVDPAYGDRFDVIVRNIHDDLCVINLAATAKLAVCDGERLDEFVMDMARSRAERMAGWTNE